jgi:hypothetical protein
VKPWRESVRHHHERASDAEEAFRDLSNPTASAASAIVGALLALVATQVGIFGELRKIRKILEAPLSNAVAEWNAAGRVVPKEGDPPMSAGPFNPSETENVQLVTAPVNAAGAPCSGPFNWSVSDTAAGSLVVSDDQKSALFVTNAGTFDVVVIVTQPTSGSNTSFAISRAPVDNAVAVWNESGQVVPKV